MHTLPHTTAYLLDSSLQDLVLVFDFSILAQEPLEFALQFGAVDIIGTLPAR